MINILNWFKKEETETYTPPAVNDKSLTRLYFERYLNKLNDTYSYDIREQLKSGMIVTHKTNISLQEVKDYTRLVWIESVPPNFIIEVTN